MKKPNYFDKVLKAYKNSKYTADDGPLHTMIYHENNCPVTSGASKHECNCDVDIKILTHAEFSKGGHL